MFKIICKNFKSVVISILLAWIIFSPVSFYAVISKDDCPPISLPFTSSIELSQNRFTNPCMIDLKINLNGIKDCKSPIYIYMPNGKRIDSIGNNGELYLNAGQSVSWDTKYAVSMKEIDMGLISFVVKYPVVLNKNQTVYRNYTLPIEIKKLSKNNLSMLDISIEPSHKVALANSPVYLKFKIKNDGLLKAENILLNVKGCDIDENINIGSLSPNEFTEKQLDFSMPNRDFDYSVNIEYSFINGTITKTQVAEAKPINIGLPFLKLIIE